jgi:tetratricopeptide (TPR) repeat protein
MIPPNRADITVSAMGKKLVLVLFLFTLSYVTPVLADSQQAFKDGVEAFRNKQYQDAADAFERAWREGLETTALYYNLGASYYKLGRYDDALRVFEKVAQDKNMRPLAFYNMGLIAQQQSDYDLARRRFRQVLQETDNPALQRQAKNALRELDKQAQKEKRWSGFASASLGYDDNVILAADTQTVTIANQDDTFLDVFAAATAAITSSVEFDGSAYLLRYNDLSQFDLNYFNIGLSYKQPWQKWQARLSGNLSQSYLSGSGFLRESIFGIQARRTLANQSRLRLRYRLARIDELTTSYAHLAGWRHQAQIRSTWYFGKQRLRLYYTLELNDREDLQSPRFTSYSPTRHILRANWRTPLFERVTGYLDVRYRNSRYNDPNVLAGGAQVTRSNDRFRFIARAVRTFARKWDVSAEYNYTNDNSNIDVYSYTRNQYMLSVAVPW